MIRYIIKRILWMIPILFAIIVIVFTICHFMPGDPVLLMVDSDYTQEEYDLTAQQYGLDKPYLEQLFNYIKNFVLHGSLGKSYASGREVTKEVEGRIWVSVRLGLMSICLTTIIAIPVGIISAIKQNSVLDYTVSAGAIFLASMPGFWLALMAIIVFCLNLRLLPAAGLNSWKSYILPVVCNALAPMAITLRMTRSSMLEVIRQDYISTARAKGLKESTVILRHAFKNALIPVITVVGAQCSMVIGGSVVIETVFSIQGMGTRMVQAISARDHQVVLGITIITSMFSMIIQLLVDIMYAAVDPRIKAEFSKSAKRLGKPGGRKPAAGEG